MYLHLFLSNTLVVLSDLCHLTGETPEYLLKCRFLGLITHEIFQFALLPHVRNSFKMILQVKSSEGEFIIQAAVYFYFLNNLGTKTEQGDKHPVAHHQKTNVNVFPISLMQ